MSKKVGEETEFQEDIVKSFQPSKIIVPILLGLGVVVFLIWKQFDLPEFQNINWSTYSLFWIFAAIFAYVLRHLFYSFRLSILTDWEFSLKKSVELIFIWEFASAVSPTSIGGSAVALFLLAQEKIKGAKAITAVMYSVIIDTLFFVISLPLLYFTIGPIIIRPEMHSIHDMNGYGFTFFGVWFFMLAYGMLMLYGLIKPRIVRRLLVSLSKVFFLEKYKEDLVKVGRDIRDTAKEIKKKKLSYHFSVILCTFGAWVLRFLAVNFIIIAFIKSIPLDFYNQIIIYARNETMYAITQFSPTPGAAGVSELLFGGFFSDYIPKGVGSIVALIWRLITYYPYLILGVILVPNWLRKIMIARKRERELAKA